MFIKSREKLRRRQKPIQRPRSYALTKRFTTGYMSYETKMKLLKLEKRVPIVHVYNEDDFFPNDRVVRWVSTFVNFLINAFFFLLVVWILFVSLVLMGPSRLLTEAFVLPLSYSLEYAYYDEYNLEKFTRSVLQANLFALG